MSYILSNVAMTTLHSDMYIRAVDRSFKLQSNHMLLFTRVSSSGTPCLTTNSHQTVWSEIYLNMGLYTWLMAK